MKITKNIFTIAIAASLCNSFPCLAQTFQLSVMERDVTYEFNDYPKDQGGPTGSIEYSSNWGAAVPPKKNLTTAIRYSDLDKKLDKAVPFTNNANQGVKQAIAELTTTNEANTIPDPPCEHAELTHQRVWVVASAPVKQKTAVVGVYEENGTSTGIQLSIPKGSTKSDYYDVVPSFTGGGGGKNEEYDETIDTSLILLPVGIEEVISDQISGNDANKLPTAFYVGEPNNPMLMATRTGQKARLRVKMAGAHDLIYVGARKIGTQKILGFSQVANKEVELEFDVPVKSHDIYEIVAGGDLNQNNKLDDDEAIVVFEKTPGGSGQYWDRVIIVDKDQFDESKDWAISRGGFPFTYYAGDLLKAFGEGSNVIPDAQRQDQITISSTEPGLSHPVGSKWNAANQDTTYRFVFDDGDPASEDIDKSEALRQIVEKMITDNKAGMLAAYTGVPEWLVSPYYNFNETKDLLSTEPKGANGFNELGNAFGKIDFMGDVRFSYKKVGGKIQIGSTEIIGSFSDVYDFAYGGGSRARIASMAQSGHATLAGGNNGKVFFTHLNFDSGWSDEWNGDY